MTSSQYIPTHTAARILCCECGISVEPNAANMCMDCIRSRVDITEGIPKQIVVNFCRGCDRYLQPPAQWLACELESKELLALLLKRIKGLGGSVRLIDAGFIWTEPHSRRIKVKLTIQKEAFAATILQQTFVVEATVANQQCTDCARREAKNTWNTVVQVRQKADHKRTFLHLEQLILKHNAHRDTVNIRPVKDGIDFYYGARTVALRFCDFLSAVVPIRSKASEQLLTTDVHSGESTFKFTYSVEILPICRDDLVFLPPKTVRMLGGINPLMLCARVGTSLHLVSPLTLASAELPSSTYWADPFTSLCTSRQLTEFMVIDIEEVDMSVMAHQRKLQQHDHHNNSSVQKHRLVDVLVARTSDFGRTSTTFMVRSHLGNILSIGDVVLGYDLCSANFNHEAFAEVQAEGNSPDIILVRKSYAHLRRSQSSASQRKWKLRQLAMEVEPGVMDDQNTGIASNRDMERFMEELEEDADLRSTINIYRNPTAMMIDVDGQVEDECAPSIPIEELLDDLSIS